MALRLSAHMTIMQNAAQRAAKRLLRDFNEVEQLQVSMKGPGDFVSQADIRAEQTLRDDLNKARPGYAFLLEEAGASGSDNWSWRWVIDPLDGTSNFLHGIPHWAISIGLEHRLPDGGSELAAGMVYAPAAGEMFWAEKGAGAFLNDRRLRVSARRDLKEAIFATGIPFAAVAPRNRLAFARTLGALMPQVAGIRRFGAASLDLAWTAAGRYDGFWEFGLQAVGHRRRAADRARGGRLRHRPVWRRPAKQRRRGGSQPASARRACARPPRTAWRVARHGRPEPAERTAFVENSVPVRLGWPDPCEQFPLSSPWPAPATASLVPLAAHAQATVDPRALEPLQPPAAAPAQTGPGQTSAQPAKPPAHHKRTAHPAASGQSSTSNPAAAKPAAAVRLPRRQPRPSPRRLPVNRPRCRLRPNLPPARIRPRRRRRKCGCRWRRRRRRCCRRR